MKTFFSARSRLHVCLLAVVLVVLYASCARQGDELTQVADGIRQHAAKQNPAFRAGRLRYVGTIDDANSDGVCACIQVCDSKGNCTSCVCSPANCGKCD